jgi:hypothetical protein
MDVSLFRKKSAEKKMYMLGGEMRKEQTYREAEMRTSELGSRGAAMLVTQPVKSGENARVLDDVQDVQNSTRLRQVPMQSKLLKRLPLWPMSWPRSDKDSAMGVCF